MKRLISALMLIVLFLSCTAALAEDEKELTCQDVPWFSTPEKASAILMGSGFIDKQFSNKNLNNHIFANELKKKTGNYYFNSSIGTDPDNEICPYAYASDRYPPLTTKLQTILVSRLPKTIAQQVISRFWLMFTPDPDKPQLVECMITFKSRQSADMKVILNALQEAYGTPASEKSKTYIWLGGDNTIVLFYPKQASVVFATLDGLAMAEAYDIEIPGPTPAPEDTGF